jgi:hypothetical protein
MTMTPAEFDGQDRAATGDGVRPSPSAFYGSDPTDHVGQYTDRRVATFRFAAARPGDGLLLIEGDAQPGASKAAWLRHTPRRRPSSRHRPRHRDREDRLCGAGTTYRWSAPAGVEPRIPSRSARCGRAWPRSVLTRRSREPFVCGVRSGRSREPLKAVAVLPLAGAALWAPAVTSGIPQGARSAAESRHPAHQPLCEADRRHASACSSALRVLSYAGAWRPVLSPTRR